MQNLPGVLCCLLASGRTLGSGYDHNDPQSSFIPGLFGFHSSITNHRNYSERYCFHDAYAQLALPVIPYGVSTHRSSFAATLNAGRRAFEDFRVSVIDILVAHGFNRFYFMSGHGGNSSFLVNIVKYAGERHRQIFCATTWLHTSGRKTTQ